MTLKQLKYLIGIVDSGLNIISAAERLYTSQPGISKQLKQLEAELGAQLFTRKGKSLRPSLPPDTKSSSGTGISFERRTTSPVWPRSGR